ELAIGHDLGEGSVRLDRRQPAELEEAAIPQFQAAVSTDHRHALRKVVHGALQQTRLLRQGLFAAHGFADFYLGDIGIEHHQPALAGGSLADLHPAPIVQAVDRGLVALAAVLFGDQATAVSQPAHVRQAGAAVDASACAVPQRLEAAVEEDDALVLVEQYEGIGNALYGVDQVLMRGFRTHAGVAE